MVEVGSIHGGLGGQRMIFYRYRDAVGTWHQYGPVITTDDAFDVAGFKTVVEVKMAEALAAAEFEALLS